MISLEHSPVAGGTLLAELARLSDDERRRQFLAEHPGLNHHSVVDQLADVVRERVRSDLAEAAALSEAAMVIAQVLGTDEALALAFRAKANTCWFQNDLKSAVTLFSEAARRFEACGNRQELGRTLSSSIQSLILLGEYARALEAADRARVIFTDTGDDRRLARLDINVANIFHRQDRQAEAFAAYERAYSRLLPYQDVEAIGVALHNMSVCLIAMNDFEQALETYQKAREHCAAAEMPRLVAQADYNIAYLHFFRGDYSRALDMLRAARVACQKSGDLYHAALCNLDQSDIYLELNLSVEAAEMAHEAHTQFESIGNGYEAARSLANVAIACGQQKEAFRALELFGQARARFEREQNAVWPFVIDLYQAVVLCNAGRFFEARRLCANALTFFRTANLQRKAILCELLLARVALHTRDLAVAREHCQRARTEADAIEAPVLDYQAYFLKGQIEEAAGDWEQAYESFQIASKRLEAVRSALRGEDLKIAFMTCKVGVYERLIELCLRRETDESRAIFGYIEQAKARSLRDLFVERVHPSRPDESGQSELVRQIRTLREELNWYYHRIEAEQLARSPDGVDELQAELRDREQMFIRVLREMPVDERESLGLHDASASTPEEARAALPPDAALVEYFATDERILAAVLTDQDLRVVSLTTAARVRHILRLLQFQLSKFQFGNEYLEMMAPDPEATQTHLHDLYEELIEPLELGQTTRLVIVPHDVLHYVPFHALFDGRGYLGESVAVSYAPSASVYCLCRNRARSRAARSLVLGVPDTRAPFILDEVEAVARALADADLRIGGTATAAALHEHGGHSRIVHIATHGHFREDNPMFSGVRLSDGYLTLHDLYDLQLHADLVTLSGCGTGLQVVAAGDELRGLVRGLLVAGARSVLVSLWNVDDRSTAAFMSAFYRALEASGDTANAIRTAMADVRRTHPHPYYWAPFVLVGADALAR